MDVADARWPDPRLPQMYNLCGYRIVAHPHLTQTHVRRVRGGYLNRWWIREIVTEPYPQLLVVEATRTIYAHPEIAVLLRRALSALPRSS